MIHADSFAKENKILIKINNNIITSYDLLAEINYLKTINDDFRKLDLEKSIEIAKNSLIREKIKEIELKKIIDEIELDEDQLNQILISYFNNFGIKTINEFEQYFKSRNNDLKKIRKKITLEIVWNQFIYSKFKNKVRIDKKLIEKEIKKNNKTEEYLLSEILFDLKEKEELSSKLKKIRKEIIEKSFSEAALKFSISDTAKNGGNLGWLKQSVLSTEIREELSKIKNGDYTSPITIPGGFLILKIEDTKILEKKDFNKELNYIIQKKTEQQLNQFSNIYLKKIRKNIQINEL